MKIKLKLDDDTRAVWETAQRAKAQVERWPAWKRGEESPVAEYNEHEDGQDAVVALLLDGVRNG